MRGMSASASPRYPADLSPTIMETEIEEQPTALARTLEANASEIKALCRDISSHGITTVMIAARGSSDNAGVYANYLFQGYNGLPVAMATPSLYTFYRTPPRLTGVFVLGISQSGQSEDIVEVMAEARRQGALTAAITRDEKSPLAAQSHRVLRLETGPEKAVAATKTFTSSLALIASLSVAWEGSAERAASLARLPELASRTLELVRGPAAARAPAYKSMNRCVVIGRGFCYGIAMEIALKLKELTYVTAEPYSSADFQHGPMAMVEDGFPVVLVAPRGVLHAHMAEFARRMKERNPDLIAISDSQEILEMGNTALPFCEGAPEWLSPILAVLPGQIFALRLSVAKGIDPDVPRGLRKVTVTR
jgi:glucosamine--fructose-6-phosphate aminotransferase (isomerizing)